MNDILRLARAVDLAARWHADQRRKGARAEPYFNHLAEVAYLVAEATEGRDPNLVIAALLHDAVEDQGVAPETLASEFGEDVADLVAEVSDDKRYDKAERKRLQIEHAPHKSPRAAILKLADKTANLQSLLDSPPPGWSRERRYAYFDWARAVVHALPPTPPHLRARFDALLSRQAELAP